MLASVVTLAAEAEVMHDEEVVPLPALVYGIIAFVILLLLLVIVTRLDLDR